MKLKFVLFVVCCLLSVGFAQWWETTVRVPDTFCVGNEPYAVAYCPVNNRVYAAGGSSFIIALDGESNQRVAKVDAGEPSGTLLWASTDNKLYALHAHSVGIIDAGTGRPIAEVPLPRWLGAMLWDSVDNRVYVAIDSELAVIDGATNQLDTLIGLPCWSANMCWNPVNNKLYVTGLRPFDTTVMVVACSTNSVIRQIPVGRSVGGPVWHQPSNRVYVFRGNGVVAIDCTADTLVGAVLTGPEPVALASNRADNKVYVADGYGRYVAVINGTTNQVTDYVELEYLPERMFWDGLSDRLFVVTYDDYEDQYWLEVFDGASNGSLDEVSMGGAPGPFCGNTSNGKVYEVGPTSDLFVFSPDSLRVPARVGLTGEPVALSWSRTSDRVYVADRTSNDVTVLDGEMNQVLAALPVPNGPIALAWNATGNKLYVGCERRANQSVYVFECDSNRLVARPGVGYSVAALLWEPLVNKVYVASQWVYPPGVIAALDGSSDAIVGWNYVLDLPRSLCRNPTNRKVYALSSKNLYVLDIDSDSLVASVPVQGYDQIGWDSLNNKVFLVGDIPPKLTIINGATNQVETTHAILRGHLFCHPSNGLAYLGRDEATAVFSGATNQYVTTIYGGGGVLGWNPDRNRLYAARVGSDSIAVIDCGLNQVVGWFRCSGTPYAWAWNSTDHRAYMADSDSSTVSIIRDTGGVALAEGTPSGSYVTGQPTVVRGVLFLPPASSVEHPAPRVLLDISGRRVRALRPGANDVRGLSPGVYFVREEPQAASLKPQAIRKVVLTE